MARTSSRHSRSPRGAGAAIVLSAGVLFVLVNAAAAARTAWKASRARGSLVERYGIERVGRAYPEMTRPDLEAFLHENQTARVLEYEPFTECRPRPFSGRFIHVTAAGYRVVENQG